MSIKLIVDNFLTLFVSLGLVTTGGMQISIDSQSIANWLVGISLVAAGLTWLIRMVWRLSIERERRDMKIDELYKMLETKDKKKG
jgi:cytochrome c biogenesis protein CcdA